MTMTDEELMIALGVLRHDPTVTESMRNIAWRAADRLEALTAALPHMSGVRVNPLEWEPVHGEGVETYQATCATGIYRVFEDEDSAAGAVFAEFAIDVSRFCMTDALSIGRFHNFDVAQAAAQADYERRILSAIEPIQAPQPEPIDQLGEALAATMTANEQSAVEFRKTFVIPEGYEAVRDNEGRATGETRPIPAPAELEEHAWNCDQWPAWLHQIVDKTNEVSDCLDMSSEQAIAYGASLARSDAQAALTASQQELERLERERDDWRARHGILLKRAEAIEAHVLRVVAERDRQYDENVSLIARNAELVKAMEEAKAQIEALCSPLDVPDSVHAALAKPLDSVTLGGQRNGQ